MICNGFTNYFAPSEGGHILKSTDEYVRKIESEGKFVDVELFTPAVHSVTL